MQHIRNPHRASGGLVIEGTDGRRTLDNPAPPRELLAACPAARVTPLLAAPGLAQEAGVAGVWAKDERDRMGLGSFKALGAAHAIAREAAATGADDLATALEGRTYVCASAGNHGLSVAAGARIFGAAAVIYVAQTVPESFAARLAAKGARVVREGAIYEDAMAAAQTAAEANGWTLLSDSSWPGYTDLPQAVMEGYLVMAAEAAEALDSAGVLPTHILLQAGVGGLAAGVAAYARRHWGSGPEAPRIVVVEPTAAPALLESIRAGRLVETEGPESSMGRLDCKVASILALQSLSADADDFVALSDEEVEARLPVLAEARLATTPSGGAGLAALLAADAEMRAALGLDAGSRVLAFVSEAAEDAA